MRVCIRRIGVSYDSHPLQTYLARRYSGHSPARTITVDNVFDVKPKVMHYISQVYRDSLGISPIIKRIRGCAFTGSIFAIQKLIWRKPPEEDGVVDN